ncbi:hypothetical protein [Streptomyces sp. NPDC060198]|uniref:hypothetical protein n=1 Tax=Streptomyces sp. NPDC060198 TaxID=3347070 RepID=UPI0036686CEA
MSAPAEATLITYVLSQYSPGICPPVELSIDFQATAENIAAVDEAAEAAIRTMIATLEAHYPGASVGTERRYTSTLIEPSWYVPLGEVPDPPGDTPPPPAAD